MKLELVHVDTCLADFWPGHHKAHVQIPVYRGMTLRAVKDALRHEILHGAVMGSDDLARLLSAHVVRPEEVKLADRAVRAAYAAVNRLKPARKGQKKFFQDLEETDESEDCVYAFFVFVEI